MDRNSGQYPLGEVQMHESSAWLVNLMRISHRIHKSDRFPNSVLLFFIAECARSMCGVALKDATAIIRDWFINAKR